MFEYHVSTCGSLVYLWSTVAVCMMAATSQIGASSAAAHSILTQLFKHGSPLAGASCEATNACLSADFMYICSSVGADRLKLSFKICCQY